MLGDQLFEGDDEGGLNGYAAGYGCGSVVVGMGQPGLFGFGCILRWDQKTRPNPYVNLGSFVITKADT